MPVVEVVLPVSPAAAFAYLADPRRRPEWQSSLRSVTDLDLDGDGGDATAAGVRWTDVTKVPGIRPRMRTVASEPGARWAEVGEWGRFRAELDLAFLPDPAGVRVVARFDVSGLGVGRLLGRGAVGAIRADLRRAGALIAAEGHE